MKRSLKSLATISGMVAMLATAYGQSTPAPPAPSQTDAKKAQKPADAKADAAQKSKTGTSSDSTDETWERPKYNNLTLDYNTWNSDRNIRTIDQNGLIPTGFGIADLTLFSPWQHQNLTAFELKGTPGDDYGTRLFDQFGPGTDLNMHAHRFSFFDPGVGNTTMSHDREWDAMLERQIKPNWGAFARYEIDQSDHSFAPPLENPDFTNKTFAVGTQGRLANSTIGGTFSETGYTQRDGSQPNTQTDHGDIHYVGEWGPKLTAEGSFSVDRIQQQGRPDDWVHSYSLSGIYAFDEASMIGAHVTQSVLQLTAVQNAYVKERMSSGLNYNVRLGGWAMNVGYQHQEEQRLTMDQSNVDIAKWDDFKFSAYGHITPKYRIVFKGYVDDLTNAPSFMTEDPSDLYWSQRANGQLKIDTGNDVYSAYLSDTYNYRQNGDRELFVTWNNFAVGGSYVFSPKWLGYAEYASDVYQVGGSNGEAGALLGYFPTSNTMMLGLDFTKSPKESLSAVMTSFYTQDEWGQQFAISYRRDLAKDRCFQVAFSPWIQRDRLYNVDSYDAGILVIKAGFRF